MTGLRLLTANERLAETRGVKIAIFGRPGVGKTSLLRTVSPQTLAETLFLDVEAGDLPVADLPVASIRPQTWPDLRDVACVLGGPNPALASSAPYSQAHYDHVAANPDLVALASFQTLFVDSLSEASRRCLTWAAQQPEAFNERGKRDLRSTYGLLGRELVSWLQQLQHMRERTVIFVAVLERVVDDYNIATWRPQIDGRRTAAVLPAIVDELQTLEFIDIGDGKPVRTLVCREPNAWGLPAKDRSGRLDQIEEPDLTKLLAKLTSPRVLPEREK